MGRIVYVREIVPGIDVNGLVPLEAIAEGRIPRYEYGAYSPYGLAAHANSIRPVILKKAGQLGKLREQVLVDLGAGAHADGFRIAQAAEARAYIGVEPHFARGLYERLQDVVPNADLGVLASISNDHMLAFLKRLPPDSVSVLIAGIDDFVVRDQSYLKQVGREIARVLHPDGAYISDRNFIRPTGDQRIRQVGEGLLGVSKRNIAVYVKGN